VERGATRHRFRGRRGGSHPPYAPWRSFGGSRQPQHRDSGRSEARCRNLVSRTLVVARPTPT